MDCDTQNNLLTCKDNNKDVVVPSDGADKATERIESQIMMLAACAPHARYHRELKGLFMTLICVKYPQSFNLIGNFQLG